MVHVTFDLVERFTPRVPKQRCVGEENITPRICVSSRLLQALQAVPTSGLAVYNMKRLGVPVVIHAYYLQSDNVLTSDQIADKVADAVVNDEMWILDEPTKVYRVDYELTDSITVDARDRHGEQQRFLLSAEFKRCKYQDNWRNLVYRLGKSDKFADVFLARRPQDLSYRTFVTNIDEEVIKPWGIELQEVKY